MIRVCTYLEDHIPEITKVQQWRIPGEVQIDVQRSWAVVEDREGHLHGLPVHQRRFPI